MIRFRFMTLVIGACVILALTRIVELINNREEVVQSLTSIALQAKESESGEEKPEAETPSEDEEAKEETAAEGEKTDEAPAEGEEASSEGEHGEGEEASSEGEHGEGEKKDGPATAEDLAKQDESLSTERPETYESKFTDSEVDILQRLSMRRQQLETWEQELAAREKILNLSQSRIQNKINELRSLKAEVEEKLELYRKKDDEKTMSLVKIYESMQPKRAAAIFSEMDMKTLLEVVRHMKEKTAAPIIARMDPEKAKKLTEEFASLGRLSEVP